MDETYFGLRQHEIYPTISFIRNEFHLVVSVYINKQFELPLDIMHLCNSLNE